MQQAHPQRQLLTHQQARPFQRLKHQPFAVGNACLLRQRPVPSLPSVPLHGEKRRPADGHRSGMRSSQSMARHVAVHILPDVPGRVESGTTQSGREVNQRNDCINIVMLGSVNELH